jgi:hypothetical protein
MQGLLARSFIRMREDNIAPVNLALILIWSQNHFQCSGRRSSWIRLSQRELSLSKPAAQVVYLISVNAPLRTMNGCDGPSKLKVNEPTITEWLLMSPGLVVREPGNLKCVNTPWLNRKPVVGEVLKSVLLLRPREASFSNTKTFGSGEETPH